MAEASYPLPSEDTDKAVGRFLNEKYPDLDPEHHASFLGLVRNFEQRSNPAVKIDDVYLIKLLCERMFCETIVPEMQRRKRAVEGSPESPESCPCRKPYLAGS
jgi:hypothetical protein